MSGSTEDPVASDSDIATRTSWDRLDPWLPRQARRALVGIVAAAVILFLVVPATVRSPERAIRGHYDLGDNPNECTFDLQDWWVVRNEVTFTFRCGVECVDREAVWGSGSLHRVPGGWEVHTPKFDVVGFGICGA